MCADKNGVEHTWHEAGAEQARARQAHSPRGDDGGGGEVPGGEVVRDVANRCREIEEVSRATRVREARRGVWHVDQEEEPPGEREDECGQDVGLELLPGGACCRPDK